jgi:hypothetical protein
MKQVSKQSTRKINKRTNEGTKQIHLSNTYRIGDVADVEQRQIVRVRVTDETRSELNRLLIVHQQRFSASATQLYETCISVAFVSLMRVYECLYGF